MKYISNITQQRIQIRILRAIVSYGKNFLLFDYNEYLVYNLSCFMFQQSSAIILLSHLPWNHSSNTFIY